MKERRSRIGQEASTFSKKRRKLADKLLMPKTMSFGLKGKKLITKEKKTNIAVIISPFSMRDQTSRQR
jgi:hypothetical protein